MAIAWGLRGGGFPKQSPLENAKMFIRFPRYLSHFPIGQKKREENASAAAAATRAK